MTVISQYGTYYAGVTTLSGRPVILDVDVDNCRIILSKVDVMGNRGEVVFNTPASDVRVRGSNAQLAFHADGKVRRINMAPGAETTLTSAYGLYDKRTMGDLVAGLRAVGANIRYRTFGQTVRLALIIVLGVFAIFVGGSLIIAYIS